MSKNRASEIIRHVPAPKLLFTLNAEKSRADNPPSMTILVVVIAVPARCTL